MLLLLVQLCRVSSGNSNGSLLAFNKNVDLFRKHVQVGRINILSRLGPLMVEVLSPGTWTTDPLAPIYYSFISHYIYIFKFQFVDSRCKFNHSEYHYLFISKDI